MGVDLQLSGDFLTLGLPSCSYPVKSECKLEVNGRDVQDMDEFSTVKQIAIFSEGDEENLQLQMCNTHQVQCVYAHHLCFFRELSRQLECCEPEVIYAVFTLW
jgi:hypothetical protein